MKKELFRGRIFYLIFTKQTMNLKIISYPFQLQFFSVLAKYSKKNLSLRIFLKTWNTNTLGIQFELAVTLLSNKRGCISRSELLMPMNVHMVLDAEFASK